MPAAGWLAVLTSCVLACASQASEVTLSHIQGLLPVSTSAIAPAGNTLMGDQVNLFNGGLSFDQTDIALPGNFAIPVEFRRRHLAGRTTWIKGEFGNWDLELPRMEGVFATATGWVGANGSSNRCSDFGAPPPQTRHTYVPPPIRAPSPGPSPPHVPESARPAITTPPLANPLYWVGTPTTFQPDDYWFGISLGVPGDGSQEVLRRDPSNAPAPTDGGVYPLLTKAHWQIACLPSVQNAAGEGFIARAPDGRTYRFDWMSTRVQPALRRGSASLARQEVRLLATEVRDRFGNWVRYHYSGSAPALLHSITSSDGRSITIEHDVNGRVRKANNGTHDWRYEYDAAGDLVAAIRPDGSRWQFNLRSLVHPVPMELGENANCHSQGAYPDQTYSGWMTHPSGATATYTMRYVSHGRTAATQWCLRTFDSSTETSGSRWPRNLVSLSLISKRLTGPGLGSGLEWRYDYATTAGSWAPCAGCPDQRSTIVTAPDHTKSRHTFGQRFRVNEGQLLAIEERNAADEVLRTTTYRYRASGAWPEPVGHSHSQNTDFLASRHRPEDRRLIVQGGTEFRRTVSDGLGGFDRWARPIMVTRESSLGHTRTESLTYHDNLTLWVIGQVERIHEHTSARNVESVVFDPTLAIPKTRLVHDLPIESYEYYADGTRYSITNAGGRSLWFGDYRRGQPGYVTYADNSSERQEINNLGLPNWRRNEVNTTLTYGYDAMGRVTRVDYPMGDPVAYHPTLLAFEQVTSIEYGLGPGHWRQIVTTGNHRMERYFDALWRERLRVTMDTSDASDTVSFVETRYDHEGRETFVSYPQRSFSVIGEVRPGVHTAYDGLGRVTAKGRDSELGRLTTTTQYLPVVFQKRVTNPRGFATTYAFQAFDTPTEDSITQIWAPEGVNLVIRRDVFGKALSVTRGGPLGPGSVAATRWYVYDQHQRLCKFLEPETGANVLAYDAAGNVAWRASGVWLPDLSAPIEL